MLISLLKRVHRFPKKINQNAAVGRRGETNIDEEMNLILLMRQPFYQSWKHKAYQYINVKDHTSLLSSQQKEPYCYNLFLLFYNLL